MYKCTLKQNISLAAGRLFEPYYCYIIYLNKNNWTKKLFQHIYVNCPYLIGLKRNNPNYIRHILVIISVIKKTRRRKLIKFWDIYTCIYMHACRGKRTHACTYTRTDCTVSMFVRAIQICISQDCCEVP